MKFTVDGIELDIKGTTIGALTAEATATADGPVEIVLYWQDGGQIPEQLRALVPAEMVEAQIEDEWRAAWARRHQRDPDRAREDQQDREWNR